MRHKPSDRLPGLDTLRSVAIVCVMLYHFNSYLPAVFRGFSRFGWMGVDLFFVLSGYLIGSQLLRPIAAGERVRVLRFYLARAYRILPAYLAVLMLYAFVPIWREHPGLSSLWEFLTFTENLFVDYGRNQAFSHVWSLCVEEHFYLLLPLIGVWLARRPSLRKTALAIALVVTAGIALRGFVLFHTLRPAGVEDDGFGLLYIERIYYPTWTRLDGLVAGVALALLRIFRPAVWARIARHGNLLALAGITLTARCVWLFHDRFASVSGAAAVSTVVGFPLLSLGLALLVASALSPRSWLHRMRVPGAETTATLAFGLYLSHKGVAHLVFVILPRLSDEQSWLTFAALLASCFSAAALLYFAVERPFLLLRDRHTQREEVCIEKDARAEPAL